jgi:hypothetical protein
MTTQPLAAPAKAVFRKVAQNLYRIKSPGSYYALLKRTGKQIRKSLKTTDHALACRRLRDGILQGVEKGQLGGRKATRFRFKTEAC